MSANSKGVAGEQEPLVVYANPDSTSLFQQSILPPDMNSFHPATFTFGTIDSLAVIINVLSVLCFPRISRIMDSEIIILMFTLTMLTFVSLTLFIIKLFDLVQSSMTEFMHLMTMFAPVGFHIVVPAIMLKAATFLDKDFKPAKITTYVYAGVCLFCMLHVVMIISPMPQFDHRQYDPLHDAHDGLHMSMATPLFMLIGAVPQSLSLFLMAKVGLVISRKKYQAASLLEGTAPLSPLAIYYKHIVRNYFVRWSVSTIACVLPSMVVSYGSYLMSWTDGGKVHVSASYLQALCDSLIFFTQPINLLLLWFGVVLKRLPKSTSLTGSTGFYQVQLAGSQHRVYLDASGAQVPAGFSPTGVPINVPLQMVCPGNPVYQPRAEYPGTSEPGNSNPCGGISGSNSVHSDV